jgi:hypothetical protein
MVVYRNSIRDWMDGTQGLSDSVVVAKVRSGRLVVVRMNDRGPADYTGRLIDLSRGAFSGLPALISVTIKKAS